MPPNPISRDPNLGYDGAYGFPTQGNLWLKANTEGSFGFSRPEDVHENPNDGAVVVVASTGHTYNVLPSGDGPIPSAAPSNAGHWTLLIIDRTKSKKGKAMFFDSLPNYDPPLFVRLKKSLSGTELVGDAKWIRGEMPRQGGGSNDCGVWLCMVAYAYVSMLNKKSPLCRYNPFDPTTYGRSGQHWKKIEPVERVLVSIGDLTPLEFGNLSREHMERVFREGRFKEASDEELLSTIDVELLYLI